jgi:hypothetical protein
VSVTYQPGLSVTHQPDCSTATYSPLFESGRLRVKAPNAPRRCIPTRRKSNPSTRGKPSTRPSGGTSTRPVPNSLGSTRSLLTEIPRRMRLTANGRMRTTLRQPRRGDRCLKRLHGGRWRSTVMSASVTAADPSNGLILPCKRWIIGTPEEALREQAVYAQQQVCPEMMSRAPAGRLYGSCARFPDAPIGRFCCRLTAGS